MRLSKFYRMNTMQIVKGRFAILLLIVVMGANLQSTAQDQPKIDSLFQILRTSKQDTAKVMLLYQLSREFFNNDIDKAYRYHEKALEIWKQTQEPLFMMLTLKHLMVLGE